MTALRPLAALLVLTQPVGCVVVVEGDGDFNADLTVAEPCGLVATVVDGVLELEGRCSEGLTCGIDVALLVPSGMALDIHTGAGDVALAWTGPVRDTTIHTDSGDVVLGVPYGSYELDLYTASGDIILAGVTPDDSAEAHLTVTSSAGDLVLTGPLSPVSSAGRGVGLRALIRGA